MMNKNGKLHCTTMAALVVFVVLGLMACASVTVVPVSYTAPARMDMSGINRIAIDSNDAQVESFISQKLNETGKYTMAPATELEAWYQWSERAKYQASATEVSADDLAKAYSENVARADSSYKKTLKITGDVKELGQSSRGRYYMRLAAGSDSVDIYLLPSEMEKFKSIDKGQAVTVLGEGSGRNLPDMEDTAEILRLLGAGSSVNVIDGVFPVGDYPGTVDAVVIVKKDLSVQNNSRPVTQGSNQYVYDRSVTVNIAYQVERAQDISLIGQGTKTATATSSNADRSQLAAASDLQAGIINGLLNEFANEMVPMQRTMSLALAKEESEDKEVKKQMSEAQKLVKAKDYKGAVATYGKIYAQYNNFAAGYNQALLTEATEGTEAAIGLMEALSQKTNNPMAQNMLGKMQGRNAGNQKAAEQAAAEQGGDIIESDTITDETLHE
ncbi:MAG: OB-fold putative lipoprotein [Treponema sp.]|jgi:hypothetical protein|nr:OB-fold putative lipoprotein [Treponema sp.]